MSKSIIFYVAMALVATPALSQGWLNLQPGTTTEGEILARFGKPRNVSIRFFSLEDFEKWRGSGNPSGYDFEYIGLAPSLSGSIHDGPLGQARDVSIKFGADKKVWQVVWTYVVGLRLHKGTGEEPSRITVREIERALSGSPIVKKFDPVTTVYRFKRQGQALIDVQYDGPGSDVVVTLSRNGAWEF